MWNTTAAESTTPAIQWIVTQSNLMPTMGRKAVTLSVSTDTAMIQW